MENTDTEQLRQAHRYAEIRNRLRNPTNAVPDIEINLQRPNPIFRPFLGGKAAKPPEVGNPNPAINWWAGRITPAMIMLRVSEYYETPINLITGRGRGRAVVRPRQMFIYLCVKHIPGLKSGQMARAVRRDHTTVLHAKERIAGFLRAGDGELATDIEAIEVLIHAPSKPDAAVSPESQPLVPAAQVATGNEGAADVPLTGVHRVAAGSEGSVVAAKIRPARQNHQRPVQCELDLFPAA